MKTTATISGRTVTFNALEVHWITLRDKLAQVSDIRAKDWRDYVPIENKPNAIPGDQLDGGMYNLSIPGRDFILMPKQA